MELNVKSFIENAVRKSDEAFLSAEFNYQSRHYETCLNRLYYAVFYIVSALGYKDGFVTSKHSQLLGWFNKKYIYEEKIFNEKMSAVYKEAFMNRQRSDYDFTYMPVSDEICIMMQNIKWFLSEVKNILKSQ